MERPCEINGLSPECRVCRVLIRGESPSDSSRGFLRPYARVHRVDICRLRAGEALEPRASGGHSGLSGVSSGRPTSEVPCFLHGSLCPGLWPTTAMHAGAIGLQAFLPPLLPSRRTGP